MKSTEATFFWWLTGIRIETLQISQNILNFKGAIMIQLLSGWPVWGLRLWPELEHVVITMSSLRNLTFQAFLYGFIRLTKVLYMQGFYTIMRLRISEPNTNQAVWVKLVQEVLVFWCQYKVSSAFSPLFPCLNLDIQIPHHVILFNTFQCYLKVL